VRRRREKEREEAMVDEKRGRRRIKK